MNSTQKSLNHPYCVISHFDEDLSWLNKVETYGTIYSKGKTLPKIRGFDVIKTPNKGGNQLDIIRFIYENYENLPETMAFLQAYPFDHCEKKLLNFRLNKNKFASLESYSNLKDVWGRKKSLEIDKGFTERNTSWYLLDNNENLLKNNKKLTCKFETYDNFMATLFLNYQPLEWIRFCPGSQYIVEKWRCLNYSKKFWKNLYDFVPQWENRSGVWPTENFLLERTLWYIFMCIFLENPKCSLKCKKDQELNNLLTEKVIKRNSKINKIKKTLLLFKKPQLFKLICEKLLA